MADRRAHRCVRCGRTYWQDDMRLCLQMPGAPLHPGAGPFQPAPQPDDMLWVCRRGRGCRSKEPSLLDLLLARLEVVAVVTAVLGVVLVMVWLARY